VGLVTEEMNLLEIFILHMPECISLVPAVGEDIKGNLSTNSEGQAIIGEFRSEDVNKSSTNAMFLYPEDFSGGRDAK
jgi:hypothetical protein